MKRIKKIFIFTSIIVVLIILGAVYYFAEKTILTPAGKFIEKEVTVKIPHGSTLNSIADRLYEEGVIRKIDDFVFTAKLFQYSDKLKAGKYTFTLGLSNYRILKTLVEGRVSGEKIVIPEGFTTRQICSLLKQKIEIDSAKFMNLVHDENFIKKFNLDEASLEGYLYPNTYMFHWGISAEEIIKKLVSEFFRNFNDSLRQIAANKSWSLHDVVTLASVIEGEAMLDSERTIISAVYHNRLQRGMLLQADPTIQYIIPNGPRRLLKKDLEIDSPYNTYKYSGLPPGPVNNPGIKSIIAAIEPASVPYIYFVARGDGGHTFSRTMSEHIKAKKKFDQIRREVRCNEKSKKGKG